MPAVFSRDPECPQTPRPRCTLVSLERPPRSPSLPNLVVESPNYDLTDAVGTIHGLHRSQWRGLIDLESAARRDIIRAQARQAHRDEIRSYVLEGRDCPGDFY